jgi:hypothetical protein
VKVCPPRQNHRDDDHKQLQNEANEYIHQHSEAQYDGENREANRRDSREGSQRPLDRRPVVQLAPAAIRYLDDCVAASKGDAGVNSDRVQTGGAAATATHLRPDDRVNLRAGGIICCERIRSRRQNGDISDKGFAFRDPDLAHALTIDPRELVADLERR